MKLQAPNTPEYDIQELSTPSTPLVFSKTFNEAKVAGRGEFAVPLFERLRPSVIVAVKETRQHHKFFSLTNHTFSTKQTIPIQIYKKKLYDMWGEKAYLILLRNLKPVNGLRFPNIQKIVIRQSHLTYISLVYSDLTNNLLYKSYTYNECRASNFSVSEDNFA